MKKRTFQQKYIYTNMLNGCTLAQFCQKFNRQNFLFWQKMVVFSPCLCRAVLLYSGNGKNFLYGRL